MPSTSQKKQTQSSTIKADAPGPFPQPGEICIYTLSQAKQDIESSPENPGSSQKSRKETLSSAALDPAEASASKSGRNPNWQKKKAGQQVLGPSEQPKPTKWCFAFVLRDDFKAQADCRGNEWFSCLLEQQLTLVESIPLRNCTNAVCLAQQVKAHEGFQATFDEQVRSRMENLGFTEACFWMPDDEDHGAVLQTLHERNLRPLPAGRPGGRTIISTAQADAIHLALHEFFSIHHGLDGAASYGELASLILSTQVAFPLLGALVSTVSTASIDILN